MSYIAVRPVRFGRAYAVGERIPDGEVDPRMAPKLVAMGRIVRVEDGPLRDGGAERDGVEAVGASAGGSAESEGDPDATEGDPGGKGAAPEGADGEPEGKEGEQGGKEGKPEGKEGQGAYKCPECGKEFATANGLAAHSRAHRK